MKKIILNLILIIVSLVCFNIQNIHSQEQTGLFWLENPYFAVTSLLDTIITDPVIVSSKLLDIRETQKFKNLKNIVDSNFQKPYLLLINRVSSSNSLPDMINNLDTTYFIEYCFVKVDTIDLWEGHPQVEYLYYDVKDSICIARNTETAISMNIMREEKLNIKISFQKPRFMFDAAIIKINEDNEDIVGNLLSFWRFKPECLYYDIDYILYEDDAYFLFDWFRDLASFGIFTKDFGFTDFDF
jgi:hypothetical protein